MTPAPERPAAVTDLHAEAEIRAAARALLRTPLLFDGGGQDDALRLVRRHRAELTRLFAEGLGYRLVVEPGVVRLFKTGMAADSTRGLLRRNESPFTPRRYALLVLVLAALTRSRAQRWWTSWWPRSAPVPRTPASTLTSMRSAIAGRSTPRSSRCAISE